MSALLRPAATSWRIPRSRSVSSASCAGGVRGPGAQQTRRSAVTGYDRLAPGTACVECVWSRWCLLRQRWVVIDRVRRRSPPYECGAGGNRSLPTATVFRPSEPVVRVVASPPKLARSQITCTARSAGTSEAEVGLLVESVCDPAHAFVAPAFSAGDRASGAVGVELTGGVADTEDVVAGGIHAHAAFETATQRLACVRMADGLVDALVACPWRRRSVSGRKGLCASGGQGRWCSGRRVHDGRSPRRWGVGRVSAMPARDQTWPSCGTRLVPAARCLFSNT
jgi:hypothetical protein